MDTMTFCVPCLFGLEGLVGDELRRLDLQNVRVEDRRVFFEGDFAAMAKANLCCRMGERVMILLAEFDAHSFEDLFQGVKAVPLERFIPKDGAFPVKGYSLNSPTVRPSSRRPPSRGWARNTASAGCRRRAKRISCAFPS